MTSNQCECTEIRSDYKNSLKNEHPLFRKKETFPLSAKFGFEVQVDYEQMLVKKFC